MNSTPSIHSFKKTNNFAFDFFKQIILLMNDGKLTKYEAGRLIDEILLQNENEKDLEKVKENVNKILSKYLE